ncbi:MAG TPA: carboxypeptidase-like regulatory domain-containing protein [Terriglobales bacterium]|nr:carboxypeptidase-like regulatory domain-containing protein [Terriglobales bacterium]
MRTRRGRILLLLAAALWALPGAAGKDKPNATIKVTVLKEENGKPVANAHVVLHPVDKKGQQERGGVELKTNQDGECSYTGVPYGRLRVQVIAHGRQTFGEDYEINQPEHALVIKLKLPQDQMTIYK